MEDAEVVGGILKISISDTSTFF